MKKTIILLMGILLVISCGEQQEPKHKKEYEEVLQVVLDDHDELMEEMPKLNQYLEEVKSRIDTVENDSVYVQLEQKLQDSHQSMFDWMHDFSDEFPDVANKDKEYSAKEYKELTEKLKKQEEVVSEMKVDFKKSFKEAKEVLEE